MSVHGIQGQPLEITVVSCYKLKDTEWISRQDPYVCLEYASTKYRTRTCTDGGKNPIFQEKFVFTLIEGLKEMNAVVWNSNTLSFDDFIGSGKVLLHKALAEGYDDSAWVLQTKTGRHAGEVRLIIHYRNARLTGSNYAPSASPYAAPPVLQASMYSMPSLASVSSYPPPASTCYPQPSTAYPSPSPSPYSVYQPCAAGYPPSPYTAPQAGGYPPPYPTTSSYPPLPYPAPPPSSSYYPPPGPFPGMYPPPY